MRSAVRLFALALFVALLFTIAPAFAQQGGVPVVSANNPNGALASYCALGYAFISVVLSVLRADNPIVSRFVAPKTAALIATGLGIAEFALLTITTGTPWAQALGTAAVSAFGAFMGHGVRVAPGSSPAEALAQKSGRPPPVPSNIRSGRGFARVELLAALAFLVGTAFACGVLPPATAPDAESLVQCESRVSADHPGATFEQLVSYSLKSCAARGGAVVLDVIDAVLASSDPNVAQYKPEAEAAKHDGAKLGALRAHVNHQ